MALHHNSFFGGHRQICPRDLLCTLNVFLPVHVCVSMVCVCFVHACVCVCVGVCICAQGANTRGGF